MRVLISAFIGVENLGDQAITQVVAELLSDNHRITQITVLSRDPEATKEIVPKSVRVITFSQANLIKELRRNDALILGGGGIINDQSSVASLVHYYRQMWLAKRVMKKPVYLLFVGVGPIMTQVGGQIVRKMCRLLSHALVRDVESAALLKEYGLHGDHITVAYDVVFNYALESEIDSKPRFKQPYYVFCPRDWFFLSPVLPTKVALQRARSDPESELFIFRRQLLALLTSTLQSHPKHTVVGVAFYAAQDLDLLEWLARELPANLRSRFVIDQDELHPSSYVGLAHGAAAVIGVRLHSLILGAVGHAPLVAMTYSEKVENLTRYLGLEAFTTKLDKPDFAVAKTLAHIAAATEQQTGYNQLLSTIKQDNLTALQQFIDVLTTKSSKARA